VVRHVARHRLVLIRRAGRTVRARITLLGENGVEGVGLVDEPTAGHTVATGDIRARLMRLRVIGIRRAGGGEDKRR
jgi:hypothetical protein